jgi:processive 1,2-diacylglycerol beta-glucosyltransferase
MPAKTILILTIGFGAGHRRAAEAVARAVSKEIADCEAKTLDVTPLLPRWFKWFYVDLYLFVIRHFPRVWGGFESRQRKQNHTAPVWMLASAAKRVRRQIVESDLAAIVSTEVGVNEIASILKRECYPNVPLLAVLTDYDVDRAWIQPEVDAYCAGSREVADELVDLGASSEKIFVTGIPVDDRFEKSSPELSYASGQGASLPKPMILLAGGGEGLAEIEKTLRLLDEVGDGTVTVSTGTNARLQKQFLNDCGLLHLHLEVQPWTDEMFRVLRRHDLLIAKPGGLTMTEAMAAGVPLLAISPLPGAEEKHCALIEKWKVGFAALDEDSFRKKVKRLIFDHDERSRISENAWKVYVDQHVFRLTDVLRRVMGLAPSPGRQLQTEFNAWAAQGRGEQMESHHSAIAEAAFREMNWSPKDWVLDLGCGSGWAARRMARRVPEGRVVGVDIAEAMIEKAQSHTAPVSHLEFRVARVEALPFLDGTFDKVFSCESFYYYPDLRRALQEIRRVLKPDGEFYCLVNLFRENPYTHVWVDLLKVKAHLLSESEYRELFKEAGFSNVRSMKVPDLTPVDETQFKPGWGIESVDDLKKYRDIGALLVMGRKEVYSSS